MRVRVVCGLSETIASLCPTMRLSSVDLPALGRPRKETKPAFITSARASFRGRTRAARDHVVVHQLVAERHHRPGHGATDKGGTRPQHERPYDHDAHESSSHTRPRDLTPALTP